MNTPCSSKATEVRENFADVAEPEPLTEQESATSDAFAALEESEASYRYLFEVNPHPMWINDSDTLRFLLVNQAAIAHYGYSQTEFLAMTIKDIRPAEDVHLLVKATREHIPPDGKRGVWRHRKKNGQSIDVEITIQDLRFRGRPARLCIVNDITERREAERALQHIMKGARCLLFQAEVERIGEGKIRWRTQIADEQAAQRFFPLHVTVEQTYSEAFFLARPREDRERTHRYATQEILAGKSFYQEFRIQNKDGALRWLSEDVRVEAISKDKWRCTGVCTDITAQKLAAEATHAMTRGAQCLLWYAFVEAQPHGLQWYITIPDEEAAQHFFPVDQPAGMTYVEASAIARLPEDSAAMGVNAQTALLGNQPGYTNQFRCLRTDGEWRWLNEAVSIEALSPGHWRCVGVCTDITEQKKTKLALRRANEELETRVVERTAEIMEVNAQLIEAKQEADQANLAKSEFLSRMSHELRTPLNAILGFGQILDKQLLNPLQKESVQYILKGGRHLLDLVNEVLDLASVESGHINLSLEPIALAEIISEACDLIRPLAIEQSILLDATDAALRSCYVLADRQRLKQVLINLLSNGIKYNRPGGRVTVSCIYRPENRFCIAVQDTGMGITPAEQQRLFVPFERLNAAHSEIEGTGLGLVTAQRLVIAMGGSLTLTSLPGEGSIFFVDLPQAASPEEILAEYPIGVCEPAPGLSEDRSATVLYIEDNLSNVRLMEVLLRSRPGITLQIATRGNLGLEMAQRQAPDLIFLDINLPDISGREVLAQLQTSALTRDIPVIILSADATAAQIERMQRDGAIAYLTKPLEVVEFLHVLDKMLPCKKAGLSPAEELII